MEGRREALGAALSAAGTIGAMVFAVVGATVLALLCGAGAVIVWALVGMGAR